MNPYLYSANLKQELSKTFDIYFTSRLHFLLKDHDHIYNFPNYQS